MWSTSTKSHVRVGVSGDVELLRVGEDALISVCGDVVKNHLVALFDVATAEFNVGFCRSAEVHDRGHEAQHLFNGRVHERAIVAEEFPLFWVLKECGHGTRDEVSSGLIARHGEQQEEQLELKATQLLTFDFNLGEDRHEVIVGVDALFAEQR